MSTVFCRRAQADEAVIIADHNRAMAVETEGRELSLATALAGVENFFHYPQFGFYLMAEVEGQIAGSLMITYEWSDWRNGLFWWIQSVYVRPQFRRQGVYRAMYADLQQASADSDIPVCGIRLYVERENRAAQATYGSLGMTECHYLMYEAVRCNSIHPGSG